MKVLLLGEYSNVHWTLAEGLRARGHQVMVVSNGDFWKDYPRDLSLVRKEGRLGSLLYMYNVARALPKMKGYDVVQIINPMFLELKAERIRPIYDYLRKHNKAVVLGAFGMDYYWVKMCVEEKLLRYSDFNIGDQLRTDDVAMRDRTDWCGTAKEALNRHVATTANAIVSGLYEYDVAYKTYFPEKTHYIPFPIKIPIHLPQHKHFEEHTPSQTQASNGAPLKLFIGINTTRSAYKGTDIMLAAAEEVARRYPDKVHLRVARSLPFHEYCRQMNDSDVLLDQLYSYTPAMNALEAMSRGIVVVGGGEEEFYKLHSECELRPIVNVQPNYDSVLEALSRLVLQPEEVKKLKKESLLFIERHHNINRVAEAYEELYYKLLDKKMPKD